MGECTTHSLFNGPNLTTIENVYSSPQRYWFQQSTSPSNSSKWTIHLMGGGWCEDLQACAERAYGKVEGGDCYIGCKYNTMHAFCLLIAPPSPHPMRLFSQQRVLF